MLPLPLPVKKALEKLGRDLSYARRRRHLSQAMLAQRIGTSERTVRRMEAGDPAVALQHVARAMHVFSELERLAALMDSSQDSIGLMLMDEKLPERVRQRKPKAGEGAF